jgi:hypothetical protein
MTALLKDRSHDLELMDLPDFDPDLARQSYRFMSLVNRLFGGARNVRLFVARQAKSLPPGQALRILDIGAGICDIPIAVTRWALRRGLDVRFTCLEISPCAPAIARARIEQAGLADRIQVVQEDAFTHHPDQPYDCAVGSMFFHHLKEEQILRLVGHLRAVVRQAILVNDLGRNWPDYVGAWLLTLPLAGGLRHDALLSIRRSFRPRELAELLARVPGVSVQANNTWLFRIKAIVHFREDR